MDHVLRTALGPHSSRSLPSTAMPAHAPLPPLTERAAAVGSRSNSWWAAAIDNTKSRLGSRERHVVGHYRLGKTLEGERAKLFRCDASLERDIDPLAEQYLAVLSLGAEPGRHIAHG